MASGFLNDSPKSSRSKDLECMSDCLVRLKLLESISGWDLVLCQFPCQSPRNCGGRIFFVESPVRDLHQWTDFEGSKCARSGSACVFALLIRRRDEAARTACSIVRRRQCACSVAADRNYTFFTSWYICLFLWAVILRLYY